MTDLGKRLQAQWMERSGKREIRGDKTVAEDVEIGLPLSHHGVRRAPPDDAQDKENKELVCRE